MAASPRDPYAYSSVLALRRLRGDSGLPSVLLEAADGHGVQMFGEPRILEEVAGWVGAFRLRKGKAGSVPR